MAPGCLDSLLSFPAICVCLGVRIAVLIGHERHHRIENTGIKWGGSLCKRGRKGVNIIMGWIKLKQSFQEGKKKDSYLHVEINGSCNFFLLLDVFGLT